MYGSNNIFSRNNGSSQSYNNSPSVPSYNRGGTQKLGSYRTQYKFDEPPSHLTAVIQNWKITPPLSITARQELLHLSPTEVRVEDYYMIRKKMLKSTHQDKLRDAIRSNCFNEALMKNQCYNLLPFSRDRPYDFDTIKSMARKNDGYNSNNSYSYNNSYSSGGQNNNSPYMRNSGSNIFNSSSNNNNSNNNNSYGNNAANIFGRNTSGSNNMSSSNIFARNNNSNVPNSSGNNIFSQNQSSNNNSYSSNNNMFNRDSNSGGHNIFAQNSSNNNSYNNNNNNSNSSANMFNRGSNSNNGGNNLFGNNSSNNGNNNRGNNLFGNSGGNNIFANQGGNNNYNNGNYGGNNNIFSNNNQNNGYNAINNMPNSFMTPEVFQEFTNTLKSFSELFKQVKNVEHLDYHETSNQKQNPNFSFSSQTQGFDNGFYDINNTLRKKKKQQQQVYVKFEAAQPPKRNNMIRSQISNEEPNRFSYFEQNQAFNGSRITHGVSQINKNSFRNQNFNEADQKLNKSHKFSNIGSQKMQMSRSKTIWQSYNQPCILQLELTINWVDWNKSKGEIQFTQIHLRIQSDQMRPNDKNWLTKLVKILKQQKPIVRSDAIIQISQLQNVSNSNQPIFSMKGVISQKIINLDGYQIQYRNVKKDCIFKLQIKNSQGQVRWEKPIKFVQLDCNISEQPGFSLEENQISCNVPQLNDKCVVCFNKLPDKIRDLMGNDNNNKGQAFNFFSSKIQAKTNGNFQLVDIWRDDNTGDEGWEIIVHKFF